MTDADKLRDDLAATSESLQEDAKRLLDIEEEKQGLDAGSPRVDALSLEAERLAMGIAQKSHIERDLADEIPAGDEPPARSN